MTTQTMKPQPVEMILKSLNLILIGNTKNDHALTTTTILHGQSFIAYPSYTSQALTKADPSQVK